MSRIIEVDMARGLAVVLMIVYHLAFDLYYFRMAGINIFEPHWVALQRLIGTGFLLLVGISIVLSERRNKEGYTHHLKRAAKLGIVALLITLATWIYPHTAFIKFGVIHAIAACTLIAPLLMRLGRLNLVLATLLIAGGFFIGEIHTDNPYLFWIGLTTNDYQALDHYALIPWLGVVLAGMTIGPYVMEKLDQRKKRQDEAGEFLALLGRNSLMIYLIHQPILIATLFLVKTAASTIFGA